jgi:hypothetical protein
LAPDLLVPGQAEVAAALREAARTVIAKHHRGPPPLGWDWSDLRQEVILRALPRLRAFRRGGSRTLQEYAYMSCYFGLRTLHRECIRVWQEGRPDVFNNLEIG